MRRTRQRLQDHADIRALRHGQLAALLAVLNCENFKVAAPLKAPSVAALIKSRRWRNE